MVLVSWPMPHVLLGIPIQNLTGPQMTKKLAMIARGSLRVHGEWFVVIAYNAHGSSVMLCAIYNVQNTTPDSLLCVLRDPPNADLYVHNRGRGFGNF